MKFNQNSAKPNNYFDNYPYRNKDYMYEQYFIKNLKQIEIANILGVKQAVISKWLNIFFSKDELKIPSVINVNKCRKRGKTHPMYGRKMPETAERNKKLFTGKKLSKERIQKIRESRLGKKHSKETREKLSKCKMGEKNPMYGLTGEKSPFWKQEKTDNERLIERKYNKYNVWRVSVYERDNYTCQVCYSVDKFLNAHHLENYSSNKELRLDINNGVTVCKDCHTLFHKIYGRINNTIEQFNNFKDNYENN